MPRFSPDDLIRRRQRNQQLSRPGLATPADVVAWFGAVQAQDYHGAKWAVGQRMTDGRESTIEQAIADGEILRTHILRPTWHFVAADDIKWMLGVSAPRVQARNAPVYRLSELDRATLSRSRRIIERALRNGECLTRAELAAILERARIPTDTGQRGQPTTRLAYLMMDAELEGLICSGPRRGSQFTYTLLDRRAGRAKSRSADEALGELTRRYFTSHGPATLRDFVWWSGLTVAQARRGIHIADRALQAETCDSLHYWSAPDSSPRATRCPSAHLLPVYDEFLIAYRDRGLTIDRDAAHRGGVFSNYLIVNGRLRGTWTRTLTKGTAAVRIAPYEPLSKAALRGVADAARRFAVFHGMTAAFAVHR